MTTAAKRARARADTRWDSSPAYDRCLFDYLTKEGREKSKADRAPVYCPRHFGSGPPRRLQLLLHDAILPLHGLWRHCTGCGTWQCPSSGYNTTICTKHCAPWDSEGNDSRSGRSTHAALMVYFVGIENPSDSYEVRQAREKSYAELEHSSDFNAAGLITVLHTVAALFFCRAPRW